MGKIKTVGMSEKTHRMILAEKQYQEKKLGLDRGDLSWDRFLKRTASILKGLREKKDGRRR